MDFVLLVGSTCVLFVATTVYSVCGHSYELEVHVYCLWPLQSTHSYKWGVHAYCLWPLKRRLTLREGH